MNSIAPRLGVSAGSAFGLPLGESPEAGAAPRPPRSGGAGGGRPPWGRGEIDGIAVTAGPGLIGSLLVGLCFAKSLAYAWGKPLYGADHLEAHIFSIFLEQEGPFPFAPLLVSGGHTSLFRVSGWE